MTGKVSARAVFVIAAGFLWTAVAPAAAEPSDNESVVVQRAAKTGKPLALTKPVAAKQSTRTRVRAKLAARARPMKQVAAKRERRKIIEAKIEARASVDGAANPDALPATVANARAELPAASASAGATLLEVAAADQLNELDRALNEPAVKFDEAVARTVPVAAAPPAPKPALPALAAVQVSNATPWDQSSLVGKIFLAFGGVLTLASAARMLIA